MNMTALRFNIFVPWQSLLPHELCSVESFRAALGISCTGAIAAINAIGNNSHRFAWDRCVLKH